MYGCLSNPICFRSLARAAENLQLAEDGEQVELVLRARLIIHLCYRYSGLGKSKRHPALHWER